MSVVKLKVIKPFHFDGSIRKRGAEFETSKGDANQLVGLGYAQVIEQSQPVEPAQENPFQPPPLERRGRKAKE